MAVVVDAVTGVKDRLAWGKAPNGQFTVKTVYELITRDYTPRQQMESLYKSMWRVVAPERELECFSGSLGIRQS